MKIRWQSILAVSLVVLFFIVAFAAPLLSPSDDPENPGPYRRVGPSSQRLPLPPSENAILGTVPSQLDIFHTLVWGTREELKFGLLVALLAAGFGTVIGVASGYLGGAINRITMRITDGFLTFPLIAAVVFIKLIFDIFLSFIIYSYVRLPDAAAEQLSEAGGAGIAFLTSFIQSVDPFTFAVLLFSWMPYARMINSLVGVLKQAEFIQAAEAIGVRKRRIIFRHLLPNVIAPNVVLAARDVGALVILRATFTYIGLTGQSPWATILVLGRNFVIGPGGRPGTFWWVYLPISLTILLFGFSWNLLGDEVNEWLDPRNKRKAV